MTDLFTYTSEPGVEPTEGSEAVAVSGEDLPMMAAPVTLNGNTYDLAKNPSVFKVLPQKELFMNDLQSG